METPTFWVPIYSYEYSHTIGLYNPKFWSIYPNYLLRNSLDWITHLDNLYFIYELTICLWLYYYSDQSLYYCLSPPYKPTSPIPTSRHSLDPFFSTDVLMSLSSVHHITEYCVEQSVSSDSLDWWTHSNHPLIKPVCPFCSVDCTSLSMESSCCVSSSLLFWALCSLCPGF